MRVQFIRLPRSRRGRDAEIEKTELVRADEDSVHKTADEQMRS